MSAAVVLAIVVATHNVDDQATEAMRATAAEALGSEDALILREVENPSDDQALRIERAVRAQTVAQVVWLDDARTRARVRVHVVETNRWTERTIAFSSVDTPVERGRALGFALTSMLPEEALAANPHHRPERGAADEPPPTEGELGSAVRLAAAGSTGTGGGLGGAIAGELFVTPSVLLRVGFALRQVSLGALQARQATAIPQDSYDQVGAGGVGVGFWPLHAGPTRRVTAGLRLDVLALYHNVTRFSASGSSAERAKWLPGVDALAEVGFKVLGPFEVVASLGVEVALGRTRLEVNLDETGNLPLVRGVAEAGIRLSF